MTSSDEESLKRLPAVPDSVDDEVYDFLYVDRVRVSALYAQLFPQGTLKSVKTTAQHGFSDDQNIGSDIKILKAEAKSTTVGSEGIEHVFDAAWAIPVEVLSALQKRSLVRYSFTNAQLGVIVLLNGYLRIIDYVTMKDLWVPAFTLMAGEQQPGLKGLLDLIRSIPHAMHAHFLTNQGFLWASLDSTNLHAPPADIVLKHGGYISSGLWRVLFVLDTFPDIDTVPAMQSWGAGQAGF